MEAQRRSHFAIGAVPSKPPLAAPVTDPGQRVRRPAALPVAAARPGPGLDTIARLQQMLPGLRLVGADTADVQVRLGAFGALGREN